MISWMQKHNKYLVWTIWVATVTFIGAGFVGWGSYSFGSKATDVAKVGEIPIKRSRLNMVYADLYERYRSMFQGNFDDQKAEELGLLQQAFTMLETQAQLLNYAKEIGLVVSDEEVAQALEAIPAFRHNGVFSKKAYETYLKNRRLKAKTFEASLRDEIAVQKLMGLLHLPVLTLEKQSVSAAFRLADKIKYRVLTPADVNVTIDEAKLKSYWEARKDNYMTPKRYTLEIVWIDTSDIPVDDAELRRYYENNSFNYLDNEGKQRSFKNAKEAVIKDVRLKKGKKKAQRAYIDFKKGRLQATQTQTYDINDATLSADLWEALAQAEEGKLIKPKAVGTRYAVVKVKRIDPPHPMDFQEAKTAVSRDYLTEAKQKALDSLSQKTLKTIDQESLPVSDFLTLSTSVAIDGLNSQEMSQFLQKLFTTTKEKGIITVSDKHVVYSIVEQTFLDENNETAKLSETVAARIKRDVFNRRFLEMLGKQYPVEIYVKGLTP